MTIREYVRTLAALAAMFALALWAVTVELFEGPYAPAMRWIDDAAERIDEWGRR